MILTKERLITNYFSKYQKTQRKRNSRAHYQFNRPYLKAEAEYFHWSIKLWITMNPETVMKDSE